MLTLYARLTKLFRSLEQNMKVVTRNAGDKARMRANDVANRLHDTAANMRKEASELEVRAKDNFKNEINRISSVLEGV
jgi:ElaB/YqjD/DUF883 family membrane-anchored ribosome-binding protein